MHRGWCRAVAIAVILAAVAMVCFLVPGCARGQDIRSKVGAVPAAGDTLPNGVPLALARRSAPWVAMWRRAAPGFTPDSLVRGSRSPASRGRSVQPVDSSLAAETDPTVLREVMGDLSPSGRYVLIADAYRALPDPGVQNGSGGEVDVAAVLLDEQKRTCDICWVGGPSSTMDWGCWVDSTHFALAGSESDEPGTCFGFLWLYSLAENTVVTWATRPVPLARRGPYYAASEARIMARCSAWKAAHHRP